MKLSIPKKLQNFFVLFTLTSGLTSLVGCTQESAVKSAEIVTEEKTATEAQASKIVKLDPAGEKTAGIVVVPAAYHLSRATLTVAGVVEVADDRVAQVTPPVAGKVARLLVRSGDPVRAGQPLVRLDSYEVAQARAAIREAEGRVAQAHATLQIAKAEAQQAQTRRTSALTARNTQAELARAGAFSEASLQVARADRTDAQSDLLSAQAKQQSQESAYQRTERLFQEGISSKSEWEAADLERRQNATQVEQAKNRVESTEQTLAREQKVAAGGLLNRQAMQSAEAEVRASESDLTRATRQDEAAQTNLTAANQALAATQTNLLALVGSGQNTLTGGTLILTAPISGTVSELRATLGEAVERSSILLIVRNLDVVLVEARIPESKIARVRVGQTVEVIVPSFPRKRFRGVVQSLASGVDEKTRTLIARCLVSNTSSELRPEMFATVSLATGTPRRILAVPESALVSEDNKSFVFVATKEGYDKREIQIGKLSAGLREVITGMKEGEHVVSEGTFVLRSESRKDELKEE